ncbi:MAG: alpha/beta hydrolase [Sphingomonas sp.]|nr:alpha/beta hydrolase [Sphingomonas sp.]
MTNPITHRFASFDGTQLAWHELGEGRAVVLLHGFFSDAATNWIKYGHAAAVAARGLRVIMPDLRAHGMSGKPHDGAAYPLDVLARDGLALVAHLGLTDYDLGGYSLGGRTTVRMLAMGATPRRAVVSGMGYEGVTSVGQRIDFFRRVLTEPGFARGTPEWAAQAFLKTTGGDPAALVHLLDSFVSTSDAELARIAPPVLVLCGADDRDNGSAEALAAALPDARFQAVPGNHMSAVTKPELGAAIADFLAA